MAPSGAIGLISALGPDVNRKQQVVFGRTAEMFNNDRGLALPLAGLAQALGLTLMERVHVWPNSVLFEYNSFRVNPQRRIEPILDLPDGPIRSIRIKPTEVIGARLVLRQHDLVEAESGTPINVCKDANLQLVRTMKLECREENRSGAFRFGGEENPVWIASSALRELEPIEGDGRLRVFFSDDLGMDVRSYPDMGHGCLWLDVSGEPLPFQDHHTIREVMASARVISREKVGRGVAGIEKLLLEHDGIRFHA